MQRLGTLIAASVFLACLGCSYRAPFMPSLDAEKLEKAKACEICARSQKDEWHGIWDARVHSLHT